MRSSIKPKFLERISLIIQSFVEGWWHSELQKSHRQNTCVDNDTKLITHSFPSLDVKLRTACSLLLQAGERFWVAFLSVDEDELKG